MPVRKFSGILIALAVVTGNTSSARATILDVNGRIFSQVTKLVNGAPVDTDTKSAVFASSQPVDLPLVGITKLDGAAHDGAILSSGECSAVFDDGRTSQSFLPFARNDLGMDLAAYSSDGETTFDIQGLSEQRRTLRIEGWEVQYPTLGSARIRSSVSLAGALIVAAYDPAIDLTGVVLEVDVVVNQHRGSGETVERLNGTLTLTGGPNGSLTVAATGAISPALFPLIDVVNLVPDLADAGLLFVKAVAFPAIALPFDYEAQQNEVFDLTATFTSRIKTNTSNIGIASIFGLPQTALGNVMARVRNDDSGVRIENAVASIVDTTGQSGGHSQAPFFGLCGALGMESAIAVAAAFGMGARRVRRAARRR